MNEQLKNQIWLLMTSCDRVTEKVLVIEEGMEQLGKLKVELLTEKMKLETYMELLSHEARSDIGKQSGGGINYE